MKKELWYLIGGMAIGGAIGSVTSYIFTKKKYENMVNDEIRKIRESSEKKLMDDISKDCMIVKKPTEEELEEETKAINESVVEVQKVDYTTYSHGDVTDLVSEEPNGDDACDEDLDPPESHLYPVEDEARIPYIIDEDAIEAGYDVVCLTYFEKDGTLSDDVSGQLVLPEDTVSKELLEQFVNSGEDEIYICKDSHSTVYEVTRYSGSYSEEILGLPRDYGGERDGSDIDT